MKMAKCMLLKINAALCFWDLSERRAIPENMNALRVSLILGRKSGWPFSIPARRGILVTATALPDLFPPLRWTWDVTSMCHPSLPWGLWWPFGRSWCGLERSGRRSLGTRGVYENELKQTEWLSSLRNPESALKKQIAQRKSLQRTHLSSSLSFVLKC